MFWNNINVNGRYGLDSSGKVKRQAEGSREHVEEISRSINFWKILQ
jgi:hypothetical protein